MEVEVSKSPRSPLPFILSGLVIDSRLLHVLQQEHVVPIAPSLDETSTFLWCCLRVRIVEELMFADEGEWDCEAERLP